MRNMAKNAIFLKYVTFCETKERPFHEAKPLTFLDIDVTAETQHAVCTGEGVLSGRGAVIVTILRLEEACLQRQMFPHLIVSTEADAIAVHHKRDVVHVVVSQSVASQLSAHRDGQFRRDIPLSTEQDLVGVVAEFLL